MGLSIHYKGSIRNYSLVDVLTEEVRDICQSLDWDYHLWKIETPKTGIESFAKAGDMRYSIHDVKGISFYPKECEPVFMTFLPNRKLISPLKFLIEKDEHSELMPYTISTKTQFAGPDAHIALLKLLIYIKNKYLDELELQDEGLYWETQDEKVLFSQFEKYEQVFKIVESALSGIKAIPGETAESLTKRIEKLLRSKQ